MIFDLVIRNGSIISFEKESIPENSNIGIYDGKIITISKNSLKGKVTIDASNLVISPGFIDFHSHINGRYFSAECALRQGVTTTIGGERVFEYDLIRQIAEKGFLINQGLYISYSFTLRKAVGLHDPNQKATKKEISNMTNLAERFLQFGVLGIHFGLEYMPATTEEELESLFSLAKKYNKIAMVHLRRDGYEALKSLEEVIRIAKKTDAAINILHVIYMAGLNGLLDNFLKIINKARKDGCNIIADTGVYAAYPTLAGSMTLGDNWINKYASKVSEKNLLISSGIYAGQFCDKEFFKYIRNEYPATLITAFVFDEAMIPKAITPEYMMISTNSGYGPHCEGIGHPESTGTFPKLIHEYVKKKPILTLEDAIKKISYLPAKMLGLEKKGNIKEGMDADITIFNLDNLSPKSNYINCGNPTTPPEGIEYVIINGNVVLNQGHILLEKRHCGSLIINPSL
ncbi:MAG: amidohydrolase family protein [Crenarchaeota archaeon]|nr:amidohydrolase family protein [Thermoproteota archaeon]